MTVREQIEMRRSKVRICVTYGAALYVFLGSLVLILAFAVTGAEGTGLTLAKEVFTMVLPIATGIITYWFASRKPDDASTVHGKNGQQQNAGDSETAAAAPAAAGAPLAASSQPSEPKAKDLGGPEISGENER